MKYPKFWTYVIAAIVAAMIALCFISCKHEIDSGVVVKKRFKPMTTIIVPIICGKTTIMSPQIQPAQWILFVQDGDKTESFSVSRNIYNSVNVGDSISFKVER